MSNPHYPIVSLFCGAGGLDWGFRREGFTIVLACDNFPAAVNSYNLNAKRPIARVVDLSEIAPKELRELIGKTADGQTIQGVIGGPPCQGFSRGNASGDPDTRATSFRFGMLISSPTLTLGTS